VKWKCWHIQLLVWGIMMSPRCIFGGIQGIGAALFGIGITIVIFHYTWPSLIGRSYVDWLREDW